MKFFWIIRLLTIVIIGIISIIILFSLCSEDSIDNPVTITTPPVSGNNEYYIDTVNGKSIMDFSFPTSNPSPKVSVMTDVFKRDKDFNTNNDGIMTQVFTGNNASIAPNFIKEFNTSFYCDFNAKDIAGWNNQINDYNFQLHTYYKGYEFYQSKFLNWMNENNVGNDFLPSNARKYNDYRGDLSNPVLPIGQTEIDLKKTFGKKVYFKNGSIVLLQDNRYNPYRWIAPFNNIMHHEASAMYISIPTSGTTIARVADILDKYRTLQDTSKRLLLNYKAKITVDDYRKEMGEKNIFDMYKPGEYDNGKDLITSLHRKWSAESIGEDIEAKWAKLYKETRLEKPYIQVSTGILTYIGDERYYLQEFMIFNKDYISTTKGIYSPIRNTTIGDYCYEGGNAGLVGWDRISIDALNIDGVSTSAKMPTVGNSCEYIDVSGDNSQHIEKEVRGTIDITNYYYYARKNHFFPGEDGSYIGPNLFGFGVPGRPEYDPTLKPSIYSLCFLFEMAGPYRLEIELNELDIVEK